jgi:hypothetical protein
MQTWGYAAGNPVRWVDAEGRDVGQASGLAEQYDLEPLLVRLAVNSPRSEGDTGWAAFAIACINNHGSGALVFEICAQKLKARNTLRGKIRSEISSVVVPPAVTLTSGISAGFRQQTLEGRSLEPIIPQASLPYSWEMVEVGGLEPQEAKLLTDLTQNTNDTNRSIFWGGAFVGTAVSAAAFELLGVGLAKGIGPLLARTSRISFGGRALGASIEEFLRPLLGSGRSGVLEVEGVLIGGLRAERRGGELVVIYDTIFNQAGARGSGRGLHVALEEATARLSRSNGASSWRVEVELVQNQWFADWLNSQGYQRVLRQNGPVSHSAVWARSGSTSAALEFGASDLVYGPSAHGALRKLQEAAGGRLLTDLAGPAAGESWTTYSLRTLEGQLSGGGKIRFDLTHVDDLSGVLDGTGLWADKVTSQELRYVRANWERFQGNTTFYRGGAEVAAPW